MNIQNNRYILAVATDADNDEIRSVFESGAFDGNITIQYLRNPSPLDSFIREADKTVMLVLKDNQCRSKIIATGACVIRKAYISGRIRSVGYLAALKILPSYQKKLLCIPEIYEQLYELTRNFADVFFSTILSDNTAAQKMLEKQRKKMPQYIYCGDYHTYFCKTGGYKKSKYLFRQCERSELRNFFKKQSEFMDFSVPDIYSYGLENADFYGLFDDGVLLGAGYILNQQDYKQYVVRHYGGIYRIVSRFPAGLTGFPPFPKIDTAANCACVGLRLIRNDLNLGHEMFTQLRKQAAKYDFIIFGLHESDPLNGIFSRIRHIKYDSRFYIIRWNPTEKADNDWRPDIIQHDVAFL